MIFIYVMFLTAVGLVSARDWFCKNFPQVKSTLEGVEPMESTLGVVAMPLAIFWLLATMRALFYTSFSPVSIILSLVGSALLAKLGFILSARTIVGYMSMNSEEARSRVTHAGEALRKHQEKMGIAAVAIATILLIVHLMGAGL